LLTLVVALGLALWGGVAAASSDRQSTQVLDSLPLVPNSSVTRTNDAARRYTAPMSANEVLSFYRAQLPAMGWTEKSVDVASSQASGPNTGREQPGGSTQDGSNTVTTNSPGPEVGNRGPTGGGVSGGAATTQTGHITAAWSRDGARLILKAKDVREASPQSSNNVQQDTTGQSDYRLRAKVRSKS